MSQRDEARQQLADALRPDEIAAEGAAELPDREAMSLITGPHGLGPLPIMDQPLPADGSTDVPLKDPPMTTLPIEP